MAQEFSRTTKDAELIVSRALPTADGTVTSDDIDLGRGPYKGDGYELLIKVPELSATNLPSANTLTITVQHGDSATPTTSAGLVKVITGTGSTIAEQVIPLRLPSNVGRYINVKFVAAGGTGDMSAKSAEIALGF